MHLDLAINELHVSCRNVLCTSCFTILHWCIVHRDQDGIQCVGTSLAINVW